jgi:dihydrofolate reductase
LITLIGAIGLNREIGVKNQLLWNLPNDLKYFKEQTQGKTIVMGRKTFESIGKPLPNRKNIVLSRVPFTHDGVEWYSMIEEVLELPGETMIIGGSQVYKAFLPYADKIMLTIVDHKFPESDTFFPKISDEWILEKSTQNLADEKHAYDYYFCTYRKKKDLLPKRLTKTN